MHVDKAESSLGSVQNWLLYTSVLVMLMVMVGGVTRLTESGLSITEWHPIIGILPPLSDSQWFAEFEKYKLIPQYAQLFPNMDLSHFKAIFLMEWGHRLLGRLTGLVFALPFFYFLIKGRLPREIRGLLWAVLVLIGLQGAIGWWMVSSGLSERTEVAPERLAIHLLMAGIILILLFASFFKTIPPKLPNSRERTSRRVRIEAGLIAVLTFVQVGLGAIVAGARAGYTYNTWPLMDGRFLPYWSDLTLLSPASRNLFENALTIQFNHRMMAYILVALTLWHMMTLRFAPGLSIMQRRRGHFLGIAVFVQVLAGIGTLIWSVPMQLALVHQMIAFVLLVMTSIHALDVSGLMGATSTLTDKLCPEAPTKIP